MTDDEIRGYMERFAAGSREWGQTKALRALIEAVADDGIERSAQICDRFACDKENDSRERHQASCLAEDIRALRISNAPNKNT